MTDETVIETEAEDESGLEPTPLFPPVPEQASTTVAGLITDLAAIAQRIHKDYRIPINSAVRLVELGVGIHLAEKQRQFIPPFAGGPDDE